MISKSGMNRATKKPDGDQILPFEWLTSSSSLRPFLCRALGEEGNGKRVLHVGCGSSVLGEQLLEDPCYGVSYVLNVDKDKETLDRMQTRWSERRLEDCSNRSTAMESHRWSEVTTDRLRFQCVDFCHDSIQAPEGSFDLVVDKSTLDCTLCSDRTTASLLVEIYRLLCPNGGVYLLVSFHDKALLQPLLEGLPGADWKIEHHVIKREIEDLISIKDVNSGNNSNHQDFERSETHKDTENERSASAAWSSGSFNPDESYRRTVNLFLCRRQGTIDDRCALPDAESVYEHVNETTNQWYKTENPMLTSTRISSLGEAFSARLVDLQEAYGIMFTDAEREHLTFDLFLEDWNAFLTNRPGLPKHAVSLETAISFLDEMQ